MAQLTINLVFKFNLPIKQGELEELFDRLPALEKDPMSFEAYVHWFGSKFNMAFE